MADISLPDLKQRLRGQPATEGLSITEMRIALEARSTRAMPNPHVLVEPEYLNDCSVDWLKPLGAEPGPVLLYLHGGAFVAGSSLSHRPLASALSRAANMETLVPNYRLAPEHPWPSAEDDVLGIYAALGESGRAVSIAADSAGANIALRVVQRARDRNISLPRRVVLFSPWIDLDLKSSSVLSVAQIDPTLSASRLQHFAALYRDGKEGPDILGSDLSGLPSIMIQAGGDEILRDDAVRLADALKKANVSTTLEIVPGAFHVWQAYFPWLVEARTAIDRAAHFLKQ
jgi:epsilon-lactone hydrolase